MPILAGRPAVAFKHKDVVRAVRAVTAAGVKVGQVVVDPKTGTITVNAVKPAEADKDHAA
jgi:hypothetical protein